MPDELTDNRKHPLAVVLREAMAKMRVHDFGRLGEPGRWSASDFITDLMPLIEGNLIVPEGRACSRCLRPIDYAEIANGFN